MQRLCELILIKRRNCFPRKKIGLYHVKSAASFEIKSHVLFKKKKKRWNLKFADAP